MNTAYDGTVVSSQKMVDAINDPKSNILGLVPNLDDGDIELIRLKFNLAIRIDTIITATVTPVPTTQTITNSAGLVIICNNQILMSTTDAPSLEAVTSTTS